MATSKCGVGCGERRELVGAGVDVGDSQDTKEVDRLVTVDARQCEETRRSDVELGRVCTSQRLYRLSICSKWSFDLLHNKL